MKKMLLPFCLSTCFILSMFADNEASTSPVRVRDAKALRSQMELSQMKRFGGKIRKPNSEKGKILIVNKQSTVASSVLDDFALEWEKRYHIVFEVTSEDVESKKGTIVIRLEECERKECVVLAPENFWVSINITSLKSDNPAPAILKSRVEKELKRAYAFVCCGTCSADQGGLCGVVSELADIDAIAAKLYTPDMEVRIANNLSLAGIEPYRIAKYSDAVLEGWAPSPTNEFQQAIWDKIHQLPTEPIKIKPETAKVTE